ncbi:MAG: dTDP-4-dehydrorhamnose 3,5-epimerase [Caldisphaera sp.]|uniref:dTDP-4-dehydrorhamnose 3,5-epimerase n=1 Tax=Caldisphaera sp. TaxID=2060322 RepID=UPI003D112460
MPFNIERMEIHDVILIKPKTFNDNRGYFLETYSFPQFSKLNIDFKVIQENQSYSKKGVIRGLHYQKEPYAQAKLVRAVKGEIYDVAVDIRKGSPTFGKYVSAYLSEENKHMLYIPRGFAHGFQVLSEDAIVIYLVDNDYAPNYEAGIRYDDKDLNINWPIKNPILSEKDLKWPYLKEIR